jgi:hypothetical protein
MVGAGSSVSTAAGGAIEIGTVTGATAEGAIHVGANGHLQDDGQITGALTVDKGGMVGGSGTINGKLTNAGTIAPGDPQTLTLDGNYVQLPGGVLDIQVAGTDSDSYDHFDVKGSVTLDAGGMLELDFIDGFAPQTGDVFDFMTATRTTTGSGFDDVMITGLAPGFDYMLGKTSGGGFGLTALNDGVSVPEPGSVALLLGGGLLMLKGRRRRGRICLGSGRQVGSESTLDT